MIERLYWPNNQDDLSNPFLRGKKEQNLKITFHTSSFTSVSEDDANALEVLHQLSHLSEIEALDTQVSSLPYIEIDEFELTDETVPVFVKNLTDGNTVHSYILSPHRLLSIAINLVNQDISQHLDVQSVFDDLLMVEAHCSLQQNIFITLSKQIFALKDKSFFQNVNPRTPSQAVKIVGLFLRSRDNYTLQASKGSWTRFDRKLFYWVLMRHRLLNMWRYFSACVYSYNFREDDMTLLGQSILTRCTRVLKARDAIGTQFYLPQNNGTRDEIMYHLDYLLLLLTGALDSQSRIAHRIYEIKRPPERFASFRKKDFYKALRKNDATKLYNIISLQQSQDVMTLLYELRNTIHGAALHPLAVGSFTKPEESFVTIPSKHGEKIWEISERYGSPEKWGLVRLHSICVEPYTFSVTLVDECFKLINEIANATDVEKLFPPDVDMSTLTTEPPEDGIFNERNRRRIDILG